MGRKRNRLDPTVHTSISMPNSVYQKVLDEADEMNTGFSQSVVILIVLGLQA